MQLARWLGYRLGSPGFDSQLGQKTFFSPKLPDQLWGPPSLLFWGSLPRVRWTGREANHSLPTSVEVKNEQTLTPDPSICHHGMHIYLYPILRQMNQLHVLTFYFFNIHFNIILPPISRSSKWSLSFRHLYQNPICISHLPSTSYIPCPFRLALSDYPNNIWQAVQIMKLLIMQFSPVPSLSPY